MKLFLYFISHLLYPLSFLFVRSRRKAAFGSFRGAFNDNAKYLFIYTCQHRPELKSAWISPSRATVRLVRSLGFRAYHIASPRGIWHALTSKHWFYNSYSSDIMYCLSGGAICVNLWHGLPLKCIEFDIKTGPLGDMFQGRDRKAAFCHPQAFRKPQYLLTTNPFMTGVFSGAFRVRPEQCIEAGYPRCSVLLAEEQERADFVAQYEPAETAALIARMKQHSRVLIYMPTWRDSQRHLFSQSMDLPRLNEVLRRNDELLLMKPHANVVIGEGMQALSNILFLDGRRDVYPILPYTHALITDFSSILYDYILMPGKDVILYIYDYEEYLRDRECYYPYDENFVGRKVYDFDQLAEVIERHDYALDAADRQHLLDRFWGESTRCDACRRILEIIS